MSPLFPLPVIERPLTSRPPLSVLPTIVTAYIHNSLISRHHTPNQVLLSVYSVVASPWLDNTNLSLRKNHHGFSELTKMLVLPQIRDTIIQEEKILDLHQDIFGSMATEQVSVTTERSLIWPVTAQKAWGGGGGSVAVRHNMCTMDDFYHLNSEKQIG